MKTVKALLIAIISISITSVSLADSTVSTDIDLQCPNAEIFGSKMVKGVCWSCLMPLNVFKVVKIGAGRAPNDAYDGIPICSCKDQNDVPQLGFPASMWLPTRAYEVVKTPMCSPTLGGNIIGYDSAAVAADPSTNSMMDLGGRRASRGYDTSKKTRYHVHGIEFPIATIMGFVTEVRCMHDGWTKFDFTLAPTEFIPTWNDEELGLVMNAEAALFGNPMAQLSCGTDCVTGSEGYPIDKMYWCAGCWGLNYPMSGYISDPQNPVVDTSLLSTRYIHLNHRMGQLKDSVGDDAMCNPDNSYTIPKSQYRMNMIYPVNEADGSNPSSSSGSCCHEIGEHVFKWGLGRTVPGTGEDYVYLKYSYRDCCVF
ncbi:hypothetical protein A3715_15355 [Oleiphilus sp. HI0009]|nr:hypothetical protein A3715_15355 [Oleiphilus sp. HI0009]